MAKGFSKLELGTIITCLTLAINNAPAELSLKSFASQARYALNQNDAINPDKYLSKVAQALVQVNS